MLNVSRLVLDTLQVDGGADKFLILFNVLALEDGKVSHLPQVIEVLLLLFIYTFGKALPREALECFYLRRLELLLIRFG